MIGLLVKVLFITWVLIELGLLIFGNVPTSWSGMPFPESSLFDALQDQV